MDQLPDELALLHRMFSGGDDSPQMETTDHPNDEIRPTEDSNDAFRSPVNIVSMIICYSCLPRRFEGHEAIPIYKGNAITCGSATEFYIQPIQKCVDDRDLLYYQPNQIAFSADVPFQPTDARNYDEEIKCYLLEPYKKYPGFVRMIYVGDMKYNWNLNKYEFYEAPDTTKYFITFNHQSFRDIWSMPGCKMSVQNLQVKGPAISYTCRGLNEDNVYSVCCPRWPTEAKDWFYRPRNYGWPTKANLQMIANMGCDVVYAQHRDCRDDDCQWRLSFSLAEVVLLRSWTKTQQLVYHLLRFFAKKELIQKACPKEKEVLCTYHLKTLVLWTCEKESPEWWNCSVICMCSKLLRKLSEWLQRRHCPNFFIPEANLFHEQYDLDSYQATAECIQSFSNHKMLSHWFLHNYLLPYLTESSLTAQEAHDDSFIQLSRTAIIILCTIAKKFMCSFDVKFCSVPNTYSLHLNEIRVFDQVEQCTGEWNQTDLYVARRLPMKSEKFSFYSLSLAYLLRAANAIMWKKLLCYKTFLSDIITIFLRQFPSVWPKYNNFPNNYDTRFDKAYVYFLRAQEYMGEMPASVSDPEFQLLSRLSMEFLRKSVSSTDATSKDIRCAAFAYMAAICFVTSKYQTAVELTSAILTNAEPCGSSRLSPRTKEPVSAGCLMFIGDVSKIVGYLLLCRHVVDMTLDRYSEINLDLRLTPEVFAQYIMIQSMQRMSQQLQLNWNQHTGEFLMDALLLAVTKRKLEDIRNEAKSCMRGYRICVYKRSRSFTELIDHVTSYSLNEDNSIRLLMECSLKQISATYEDAFKDVCFPCITPAFCYRMVFHYSCRRYDEVMTHCEQILCEPDVAVYCRKCSFLNVISLPPFSSFFDEEMQCLIGLQTLCHVLFHRCARKIQDHCSIYCKVFNCLYIRSQYLLERHFLARYLQVRCLIDCNNSVSEVLAAFRELKCRLPFDYIFHEFLRQKLRKTIKYSELL